MVAARGSVGQPSTMLVMALASLCVVAGAGIFVWGLAAGEWRIGLPEPPHAHWRLILGVLILIGGALLAVVAVVAFQAGLLT